MIKALIVDDESAPRQALRDLIGRFCFDVEIVEMADSIESAYKAVMIHKPDVVFLDISMPPDDGFALLKKFINVPFEVVFTTAHNNYAIQAFKVSAVDYLLKPIDTDELIIAVEKVKHKLQKEVSAPSSQQPSIGKIIIPTDKSYIFVDSDNLIRIEFSDRKLYFFLKNGQKHAVNKSLTDYEKTLTGQGFFRTHRTHLINLREIKEYVPDKSGGCVIMTDGKLIPVSLRKKEELLTHFTQ